MATKKPTTKKQTRKLPVLKICNKIPPDGDITAIADHRTGLNFDTIAQQKGREGEIDLCCLGSDGRYYLGAIYPDSHERFICCSMQLMIDTYGGCVGWYGWL